MDLSGILHTQVLKYTSIQVVFLQLVVSIQALSSGISISQYRSRDNAVVNRVYELRDSAESSLHCSGLCLSTFGSECGAVAYSEDIMQGNCILISTRNAVTGQMDITPSFKVFSTIQTIMRTGNCPDGYKLNPNTGTCVGAQSVTGSWRVAKSYCENKGEYLLTLPTIQDAEWLANQRSTFPDFNTPSDNTWIAGYRERHEVGKPWYWRGRVTDAITYRLDYWDSGDPPSDADCMIIWIVGFADQDCGDVNYFYCETEAN